MLSSNIVFRSSDGHVIYDLESKKIINKPKPINIQDHVWIGASVIILKGSTVCKNSIIGTASLVTKSFSEENIIIAGNPAKKVKENINWDRRYIRDSDDYFED